jgi:mono/diheme cytochrome c family protein
MTRGLLLCVAAVLAATSLAVARVPGAPPRAAALHEASFTSAQAYAGRFKFIQYCAECHGGNLDGNFAPALVGPHSNVPWQTPIAIYTYMTAQMPVGNGGGLSHQDYLEIEAFLLQRNGRRPGRAPLTLAAIEHDPLPLDKP